MDQKKMNPMERQRILKSHGLILMEWMVMEDMEHHMIIRHRITGEIKVIDK